MPDRTCSVDGCEKRTHSRGWCITHYSRWRKTGDPGPAELFRQHGTSCSVDGCDRPYEGSGYCKLHRERWKKHGDPHKVLIGNFSGFRTCSVDGCVRPHSAKGLCQAHYRQSKNTGNISGPIRAYGRSRCEVPGCGRRHYNNGYCQRHNRRARLYGDPLHTEPMGPRSPLRGAANPAWKNGDITYFTAHQRIATRRGRAAAHRCTDCGGPAEQWSYTYECPRELVDDRGYAYSADPDRYVPRCVLCHATFDAAHRRGR